MFIEEYKNNLLQNHICKRCNRVWDEYGEEVTDNYLIEKIREYTGTITIVCPMCKFDEKGSKMYVSL